MAPGQPIEHVPLPPLLASVPTLASIQLRPYVRALRFRPGQALATHGSPSNGVLIIAEGRVEVIRSATGAAGVGVRLAAIRAIGQWLPASRDQAACGARCMRTAIRERLSDV